MTYEERLMKVARALDQEIWEDDLQDITRGGTIAFHERRQKSIEFARKVLGALDDFYDNTATSTKTGDEE